MFRLIRFPMQEAKEAVTRLKKLLQIVQQNKRYKFGKGSIGKTS